MQNLIINKIICTVHLSQTPLRDEWVIIFNHLFITIHKNSPNSHASSNHSQGYFVVVGWLVDEDRGDIKGDIVGGGGGGFFLVLLFFEDAAVRVEVVAEIIEALLRGSELAGANGVVEDDDGEERA
ncbi:hypothetical protein HN51_007437 [Arachis hypogaea]